MSSDRTFRTVARLLVAGLLLTPTPAQAATTPPDPSPTWTVDRVVRDREILESSGLTSSLLHPGVLWTHNDSGNPPFLYAVGRDGRTRARLRVTKAKAKAKDSDWEAVATLRGPGGEPLLAVADIGDNEAKRKKVEIQIFREPERLEDGETSPVLILRLKYPERASDAETLLADPRDGHLYIVTKGAFGGTAYAVPPAVWPGTAERGLPRTSSGKPPVRKAELRESARIGLPLATDGKVLEDGRVLLRSLLRLDLLPDIRSWTAGTPVRPLGSTRLPFQQQGESLAVVGADRGQADPPSRAGQEDGGRDDDGSVTVLIGSEGQDQPVLRGSLSAVMAAAAETAAESPAPVTSASPTVRASGDGASASGDGASDEVRGTPVRRILRALLLVGVLTAGGALLLLRRRRRRR